MKNSLLWAMVFILSACFSHALATDQPNPMDFAFGIKLHVSEPGTFLKTTVPQEVYLNLCRKDFGDIRVFNASGKVVPHALKTSENKDKNHIKSKRLAFFPIFNSNRQNANKLFLNINTDNQGSIISLKTDETKQANKKISFFLIDLTGLDKLPDQLKFEWSDSLNPFSVKTELEYSNDLTNWYKIKTDSALASLEFSGQTLIKNKIDLPKRKIRYLKMSWPLLSDPKGQKIKTIHALFIDKKMKGLKQWYSIEPISHDLEKQEFEYKIDGFFPLRWISVELEGQNNTFSGRLQSRPTPTSDWRVRYQGLFYNIQLNGLDFSNAPINLMYTKDQHWQLILKSKTNHFDSSLPRLKLGWETQEIYFLNQGDGPFTLAFGNHDIPVLENLVDPLLSNFDLTRQSGMIQKVQAGQMFELGGEKIKKESLPWKQYGLWAILVMGVAILGTMAIRLYRQLNDRPD